MAVRRKTIGAALAAMLAASCETSGASPRGGTGKAPADPSAARTAGNGAPSGEALECGEASYYADALAGNPTASGDPYNPSAKTAAHKTLAFGTSLRVVRPDTGAAVTVTVNDRGPFTPGRVVDLSRAAAAEIDLITVGVAEVCLYAAS